MNISRKTLELSQEALQDWLIRIGNKEYEKKNPAEYVPNLAIQINKAIKELAEALEV